MNGPGLTTSRRVPETSDNTEAPDNAGAPESGPAENSNAIALGLIGDEWNLAIIRLAIMSGVRRYKDFRDRLGIANSVLTVRLRRLAEALHREWLASGAGETSDLFDPGFGVREAAHTDPDGNVIRFGSPIP